MYYLYRHIRVDKKEPFYIGIGNSIKRAYSKHSRNRFWKFIVSKSEYEVDILYSTNSYTEIKKKEIEFINLYGRKDLNTGTLVNLTDGGEGYNKSKISIQKQLDTARENGTYIDMGNRMRQYRDKKKGGESCKAKKLYVYDTNGDFIKEYDAIITAANDLKINRSYISGRIDTNKVYSRGIFSSVFHGDKLNMDNYYGRIANKKKDVKIKKDRNIFRGTSLQYKWNNLKMNNKGDICEKWMNFDAFTQDVSQSYIDGFRIMKINNSTPFGKYNFKWVSDQYKKKNHKNIRLIKFDNKVKSIAEWADYIGIKRTTLLERINRYNWSIEKAFTTK